MKPRTKLCFYSVISNEIAEFENYKDVAEETVRLLNTHKLGDLYPETFFYLKAKVKGGFAYYAGCVADPGQWDDPAFIKTIEPDYEPLPDKTKDKINKRP